MPSREQTPRETYRPGDRIVAYVKDIDREARGPMVILSRADPHLVEKLFEAEVPEIYEGIVRIVGVAREPGSRSKIAVTTRDSDVDPVGACVGIKGSRVQAVVQELRGEKIDIVPFDAIRRATSSPRSSPPRSTRSSSTRPTTAWSSWCPTRSSRSPSAARARTCVSLRS